MKCFYHSADLDGHCSGAIVRMANPKCELHGVNYGKDSIVEDFVNDGEDVFMVDFTLQPFDRMIALAKKCNLVWIDHHKTEIDEMMENYEKLPFGREIEGIQRVGIGACALVWEYFYGKKTIPEAVKLLAEYDVWNHSDPKTLPFQYGMRTHDTWPDMDLLWNNVFDDNSGAVERITSTGRIVLNYEESQNKKFCEAYSFETEFNGFKAICCNRGFTNSKVFDSVHDEYDLMVTFCRLPLPHKKWTVSLYTHRDDLNVGEIARNYGGGGHLKAAGFQCNQLPFEV